MKKYIKKNRKTSLVLCKDIIQNDWKLYCVEINFFIQFNLSMYFSATSTLSTYIYNTFKLDKTTYSWQVI